MLRQIGGNRWNSLFTLLKRLMLPLAYHLVVWATWMIRHYLEMPLVCGRCVMTLTGE
jgi:hypothetical protein